MRTRKTKEFKETETLYLLKKDEMRLFRGGDNSDRPSDGEPKDEVIE